jgi:N6-adenosine-specific RNA methylase IME4/ParB-like chromosome segregation protein Spo0J
MKKRKQVAKRPPTRKAKKSTRHPKVAASRKSLPKTEPGFRWPSEIKVGKRHRKDFGDLKSLAASISERGDLIQPIAINDKNELIAGERRLKAWPLTRFAAQPIPVTVINIDSLVAGEWDENAQRKDFTPSEAVSIKREIEKLIKDHAKARMRGGKAVAAELKGRAGDQAARMAGADRRTIEKAEKIVDAAAKDPARFQRLKDAMDASGKVNGPFKRLRIMQQTEALRKAPPPLPMRGPYGVGVVDFPWAAEKDAEQADIDRRGRAMRDYPEMSIEEGCKLFRSAQFQALLAPDCTIYFLTTNHHMDHAFVLLKAMGFDKHSTIGTWVKNKMGRGQVLRGQTEHCIIAKRGSPVINLTNQTTAWQGAGWEVREDSRKPDALYALVEELTPAPRYFEMFSRGGHNEKWDCHGDQVGKFAPAHARAAEKELIEETAKPKKSRARKVKAADAPVAKAAEAEKAVPVATSSAVEDPDQLAIPGFLRRDSVREAQTTSLINPKLLPSSKTVKAIADRAEAAE